MTYSIPFHKGNPQFDQPKSGVSLQGTVSNPAQPSTPPRFEDNPILQGVVFDSMEEYEATFTIESKSDAYAIERLMTHVYDSVREESRTTREGTEDSTQMLGEFKAIRDATRSPNPGRFTVVYETKEKGFEE